MIALVELLNILKGVAAVLSILLSARKLYRLVSSEAKQAKTHRVGWPPRWVFLLDIKFNCDAVVFAQPLFLRAFTVRSGEGSFFIIVSK